MGVYIKGMEMPKDGSWRSIRIYPDGTIGRPIGFGDYALVDGAKAVPVPLHVRLIDADALFDFILNIYKNAQGDARKAYRDVLDTIVAAGDVIEAEEGET